MTHCTKAGRGVIGWETAVLERTLGRQPAAYPGSKRSHSILGCSIIASRQKHFTDHISNTVSTFPPPSIYTLRNWSKFSRVQWRATKTLRGLENSPCYQKLS